MKNLSIIQEYMICAFNEKGKLSEFKMERRVGFVISGILELQLEKCIHIDNGSVTIGKKLPVNKDYLKTLYDFVDQKSTIKLKKILEAYLLSFSDKKLYELIDAVGTSLEKKELVKRPKSSIPFEKTKYLPTAEAVNYVIDMIKSEIFETDFFSEEIAILVTLLEQSKLIKVYFSKFEQKELKNKLEKIKHSDNGKTVSTSLNYINSIFLLASASY